MSSSTTGGVSNAAIIPLVVLCAGLIVGGIAAIYITRKIARVRLLRQLMLAEQEALAEEMFMGRKPILTDVYIGPPPDIPDEYHVYPLPWPDFQVSHVRTISPDRRFDSLLCDSLCQRASIKVSPRPTHIVPSRTSRATCIALSSTETL